MVAKIGQVKSRNGGGGMGLSFTAPSTIMPHRMKSKEKDWLDYTTPAAFSLTAFLVCVILTLSVTVMSADVVATDNASDLMANKPLTPKESMMLMNYEDKTVDQVLTWYEAQTPTEKQLARILATQGVEEAKLQKLVRLKWGHDAETTVAHLCLTDTHDDDKVATVTLNGQHAFVKFYVPGIAPLFMVQSGVAWKIDVPTYVITLGNQLQTTSQFCNKTSVLYANYQKAIAAGKYQNAQQFLDDFIKASDVLNAEN